MMNQPPAKSLAGARFRGLLIIWGAQISSLVIFYLVMRFTPVKERAGDNSAIMLALAATALTTLALSFVVKRRLLAQAAALQRPDLVTTGYVIAFTLCEACMLLGLVAHFVTGVRESLYFIIPAALGFLLHFPRRRHFDDADGSAVQRFKSTF